MPLTPGERLGSYDILALLGAGGMGEVHRARDAKLKREVALKILPPQFTSDPDRLARFQREAEVLASLNHPNIAHIHGLEESGTARGWTPMSRVGSRVRAMRSPIHLGSGSFALHPDGKRTAMAPASESDTEDEAILVLNFFSDPQRISTTSTAR